MRPNPIFRNVVVEGGRNMVEIYVHRNSPCEDVVRKAATCQAKAKASGETKNCDN